MSETTTAPAGQTVLEAALELLGAGMAPIPVRSDGSKRPGLPSWKVFQTCMPTLAEVHQWFAAGPGGRAPAFRGLGMVCGAISGQMVMVEAEGRARAEVLGLGQLAVDSGLGPLWQRFMATWCEQSPSGGLHWMVRVALEPGETLPGNTKLARRPAPTEANPHLIDVLAETRAEGGFSVMAPTPGDHHASGNPWQRLWGSPATVVTLTSAEFGAVCALIGSLDVMPEAAAPAGLQGEQEASAAFLAHTDPGAADGSLSPGDDFEARTDWSVILEDWTCVTRLANGYREWLRPGKSRRSEGISATTGHAGDRDRLYVFSSSTIFPTQTPLTKFYAWALLNYGGDLSEAARELRRQGFGSERVTRKAATPERNAELAEAQAKARLSLVQGGAGTPAPASTPSGPQAPAAGAGATDGATALAEPAAAPTGPQSPAGPAVTVPRKHNVALTDSGNALALAQAHGHRIRYVPERGQWLVWNTPAAPGRWSPDPSGTVVVELMRTTLLAREAATPDEREHRASSLGRRSLADAVTIARGLPGIVVSVNRLDADPYVLGTPSGLVDLRSGLVLPADPDALVTRSALVVPDASCPIPRWLAFLERMFRGDAVMVAYVRRLFGYALSGLVSWHVLPFLHGPGANGKSVLAGVIRRLLGDYASAAPSGFLMAGLQQHSTELAMVQGLRLLVASEIDQRAKFDEAKVKLLTGGDAITARHMRQDFHTFTPTHKLILLGNHLPRVETGGESFWRRLRLIDCGLVVPESERIPDLDELLVSEEGPGILAWALGGFSDVLSRRSLGDPASVLASTTAYAREESSFDTFVEERLRIGGGASVRVETYQLRMTYTAWCMEEGMEPLGAIALGRELTRLEVKRTSSNGRKFYTNVSLRQDGA